MPDYVQQSFNTLKKSRKRGQEWRDVQGKTGNPESAMHSDR